MQQTRTFVLTSEPRLKYYKNDSDFRGEIPLTYDVEAKYTSDGSFKLCTPRKTFVIKEIASGEAEDWANAINEAVKRFGKNLNV
jgi:PH domain